MMSHHCPEGGEEVWRIFRELHGCRGNSGLDISRITYVDIHAYQQVVGVRLNPWELETVRKIDSAYMVHRAENRPKG